MLSSEECPEDLFSCFTASTVEPDVDDEYAKQVMTFLQRYSLFTASFD